MDRIRFGIDEDGFDVDLPCALLRCPIHVMGVPGMGKSTLLARLALQCAGGGEGVLVIDIKDGALARDVARRADPDRLVLVAPGRDDPPWGLNLLDGEPALVVDAVLDLFERTGKADLTFMTQVRQHLTMALWLALGTAGATLADVETILTDPLAWQRFLASPRLSERVRGFWTTFDTLTARAQHDAVASTVVRLDELLVPELLGAMLRQSTTTLTLGSWLNEGRLVVCDLVTGVPPRLTTLLGNVIVAHLVTAALARAADPRNRYLRIIADEFDQLAAGPFVTAIDKLRAAHVMPVMAHQNLAQLPPGLGNSLSGAPAHVFFRVSRQDYGVLSRMLGATRARALTELPRYTCALDLAEDEDGDPAWLIVAADPLGPPTNDLARPSSHRGVAHDARADERRPSGVDANDLRRGTTETPPAHLPRPGAGTPLSAGADSALGRGAAGAGSVPVSDQRPGGGTAVYRPFWTRREDAK